MAGETHANRLIQENSFIVLSPFAYCHDRFIRQRRTIVLAKHLSGLILPDARVLDVGCGDGELTRRIANLRSDAEISGVEVLSRENAQLEIQIFDGQSLPFDSKSFDTVLLVDVLHHTDDPRELVAEAMRVARKQILIKDHYCYGSISRRLLSFMDGVSNSRYGVAIPCNYLQLAQWTEMYKHFDLQPFEIRQRLRMYPWPLTLIFDAKLQFIADLRIN